jgi:GAF domain-containing protein
MDTDSADQAFELDLKAVLEAMPNPIAVLDGQGRVRYANPACLALIHGDTANDFLPWVQTQPGLIVFLKNSLLRFQAGETSAVQLELEGDGSSPAKRYILQPLPGANYLLRVETLEGIVSELSEAENRFSLQMEYQALLAELNSSIPHHELLRQILARVCTALGAQGGVVSKIDFEHQLSLIEAANGMPEAFLTHASYPLENSASRRAILNRAPVVTSELEAHLQITRGEFDIPAWQESLLQRFSTITSLPLVVNQALYGVLELYYATKPVLTQEQTGQAGDYAKLIALSIEIDQLKATEERLARELSALYRADSELYHQLQLSEILQALVDLAVEILEADKSSLFVWDARREKLEVVAAHGFKPETLKMMSLRPDEGVIGLVALSGEVAVVSDTYQNQRVNRAITDAEGIRSFIHVPILAGNQVYGVFNIDYLVPHTFSEDERRLFTALAQRASLAIESANLHQLLDTRYSLIETILSSTNSVHKLDEGRIFETLGKSLLQLTQAQSCWIYLLSDSRSHLQLMDTSSSPGLSPTNALKENISLDQNPLLERIIQNAQLHLALSPEQNRGLEPALRRIFQGGALLYLPVVPRNQTDAIALLQPVSGKTFTDQQLKFATGMASIAGVALENVRLRKELHFQAEEVQAVLHILGAVSRRLDAASILQLVAEHACRLVGGDGAFITLLQSGEHRVFAVSSGEGFLSRDQTLTINDPVLLAALLSTHASILLHTEPSHGEFLDGNGLTGVGSLMLLPIATLVNQVGALWVYSTRPDALHRESERVLAPLAASAFIALEMDRLSRS